jgi:dipeptidyl aminopeptidase/acylaminoacyl peptidase
MKQKTNAQIINRIPKIILAVIIMLIVFCSRKNEFEKGINAVQKGDYGKAVKALETALKADTLNPEIYFNLSLSYAHLDSTSKSLKHYLKLVSLDTTARFKDNAPLREMLATFLKIDPYTWKPIPMKGMNQFKGALSPDGKILAIAAAKSDVANIYLTEINGKVIKKITVSGMNTDPDFSPAGDKIIFVSSVDGDDELYTYDMKTKEVVQITENAAQDFSPAFSPDGKEIVFVSNMDDPYKWEIYKLDIEKKKPKRLTKNNYWDGFPKFSSDGKSIVFSSKRNGSENIYIMSKNGGSEKILYKSDADDNDPLLTGQTLYFKSNRDGEWEIYRFDLKNEKLFRLTYNSQPDWNPRLSLDGTKIIVARKIKKRWSLYYIDFNDPVAADILVSRIEKIIAAKN